MKEKMENEERLENLNNKIQQLQAGIEKNKDILGGFNSYKKFIDGLTEPEFLETVAEEKVTQRKLIKKDWIK